MKKDTSSYVGSSKISYSVEQGIASESNSVSGNIFWYDPFGTISSVLKDGDICEIEISMGYDSSDRDFLIQFTKVRMQVFNSLVNYISKQSSKNFTMEAADEIERDLLSIINKICKSSCPIHQVKIIRLEIFN